MSLELFSDIESNKHRKLAKIFNHPKGMLDPRLPIGNGAQTLLTPEQVWELCGRMMKYRI